MPRLPRAKQYATRRRAYRLCRPGCSIVRSRRKPEYPDRRSSKSPRLRRVKSPEALRRPRWIRPIASTDSWRARTATAEAWCFTSRISPASIHRVNFIDTVAKHGIRKKIRQDQAERKTQATEPVVQAQEFLPLHRRQSRAGGLQGRGYPEGLRAGKRQDHAGPPDRHQGALSAPS